jgi:cardiolipin synthase A/B
MEINRQLSLLVARLSNAGVLGPTIAALQNESFSMNSGAVSRAALSSGRNADGLLQQLQVLWAKSFSFLSPSGFAILLDAVAEAAKMERERGDRTEIVWTGPVVEGSYLRATRQVVQDIIRDAKSELLVVGYWLAGRQDGEGIINDIVNQIAEAVRRQVKVTIVLDERNKPFGLDNRATLIELWPHDVTVPGLLTWKLPEEDNHLKLHAKLLVADRHDSLVTSANLTMYAMDRNMEMGVRVIGAAAARIAQHFDLLVQQEILLPFKTPKPP